MTDWDKLKEKYGKRGFVTMSEMKELWVEGDNMAFNLKKRVEICNKLYENNRELHDKLEVIQKRNKYLEDLTDNDAILLDKQNLEIQKIGRIRTYINIWDGKVPINEMWLKIKKVLDE